MITLKLSSNHNPFSWGIRCLTNSPYSHVDFVIEDGWYIGSQPGTGVVLHKEKCAVEHFYQLDINPDKILKFAYSQLGKPYDYSGIIGYMAHRNWQEDDRWFCSEFVAASINQEQTLFSEKARFISPGAIVKVPGIVRIG